MAIFAFEQIDAAVSLFTSLVQHGGGTPRYHRNLQWLQKLRARASSKLATVSAAQKTGLARDAGPDRRTTSEDREDTEDIELLGWRTRLIERAAQSRPTISTIHLPSSPSRSHVTADSHRPVSQGYVADPPDQGRTAQTTMPSASLSFTTPDPTDDLVSSTAQLSWAIADMP
jgi:hypothetical protein